MYQQTIRDKVSLSSISNAVLYNKQHIIANQIKMRTGLSSKCIVFIVKNARFSNRWNAARGRSWRWGR